MSLSIGGIQSAYGMNFVQPMNLSVKNESEISDAFVETGMSGAVMNVPPVVYPNAQVMSTDEESVLILIIVILCFGKYLELYFLLNFSFYY